MLGSSVSPRGPTLRPVTLWKPTSVKTSVKWYAMYIYLFIIYYNDYLLQ